MFVFSSRKAMNSSVFVAFYSSVHLISTVKLTSWTKSTAFQGPKSCAWDDDAKRREVICAPTAAVRRLNHCFCATEHVLSNTGALSTMLQGQSVDLTLEAASESRVVIIVSRKKRTDWAWKKKELADRRLRYIDPSERKEPATSQQYQWC